MNAYELFKKENQQRHRNDGNQVNSDQEWSRELVQ
jgi:hypothetical protein